MQLEDLQKPSENCTNSKYGRLWAQKSSSETVLNLDYRSIITFHLGASVISASEVFESCSSLFSAEHHSHTLERAPSVLSKESHFESIANASTNHTTHPIAVV